ncbi:MAG: phage holin family protein [Muribaculaceae bacterium]|nr:phage holin family protein [Muribaculaceae bacterium]
MNSKKFSIGRALALVGVVFILIFSLGAVIALQSLTMIRWWIPLLFSGVMAALSGTVLWRMWQRLTGNYSFTLNFICHFVFFTLLLSGLFYTINFAGANDNARKEKAPVICKFKEKHYRSRRVGRNRYVRGPEYYEYYVKVEFPKGKEKNIQLPFSTYKGIKQDRDLTLSLSRGLLGVDVIRTSDLAKDNPPVPEKRKRCRFFGTHS